MEKINKIYKITNLETKQIYVGQTSKTLHERLLQHFKTSKEIENGAKSSSNELYLDIVRQGTDSFSIEQIDECYYRHRFIIEKYWTEELSKNHNMYNIMKGSSHSKETKRKQSEIRRSEEFNLAVYQTEEYKQKMSTVTSGENNGMFGRKDEKAPNGQTVYMLDDDKNIIKTFSSVKVALKHLGLVGHVALMKACKNGTKYKGCYWTKTWSNK